MAKYLLKRRNFSHVTDNPFRPRGQMAYHPWRTVSKHDDQAAAEKAMAEVPGTGLRKLAIFHKGKKIKDE